MALDRLLIQGKNIRVDKIMRMRRLGENDEIAELMKQLVDERDKCNKLLELVQCQQEQLSLYGEDDVWRLQ